MPRSSHTIGPALHHARHLLVPVAGIVLLVLAATACKPEYPVFIQNDTDTPVAVTWAEVPRGSRPIAYSYGTLAPGKRKKSLGLHGTPVYFRIDGPDGVVRGCVAVSKGLKPNVTYLASNATLPCPDGVPLSTRAP